MKPMRWLRERWRMLHYPSLSPRDESIALDVPIDTAIERLRRVTRSRTWREQLLGIDRHALYGTISREHVEIFFSSGAYDGEGQHIATFRGRFVRDEHGSHLVGAYGTPLWFAGHPAFTAGTLLVMIVVVWFVTDSIGERLLGFAILLAMIAGLFVGAPRFGEKVDGDFPLLRARLRRELSHA